MVVLYVVLLLAVAATAFAGRLMWLAQAAPPRQAAPSRGNESHARTADLPGWLTSFVRPDFLATGTPAGADHRVRD